VTIPVPDPEYPCLPEVCGVELETLPFAYVVTGLSVARRAGASELSWTGLSGAGMGDLVYDVLRSSTSSFESGSLCIEDDGG
jgi:hypothetical protein